MGYVTAFGHCAICATVFSFNPHAVPSVRINGKREPICRECIDTANVGRAMRGEAKIEVAPNAYESIDEEEL